MRQLLLLTLCFVFTAGSFAQSMDSTALARRDSLRMAKMLEGAMYPLIKGAKWAGVIQVDNPEELPDTKLTYKLLMDVSTAPAKNKVNEISGALSEVARIMNIHIAAGVPRKKMQVVVIAHGGGLWPFLNDDEYQKKYKCPNPNLKLIEELSAAGVRFTACGQAMKFLSIEKSSILPVVKVAYSAKTVTSSYSMKGYFIMYTD